MTPAGRTALLTLGSNIDPERNMVAALDAIDDRLGIEAVSAIYEADPVGNSGVPRFLNAAVRVTTELSPRDLKFGIIRPLERHLGRVRTEDPNAPRTIDVDIAAMAELVIDREGIRLPDPEILIRAHLALPLADVAPGYRHPTEGRTLREIAARFNDEPGIATREDIRWP